MEYSIFSASHLHTSVAMLPAWQIAQLAIEGVLLSLHIALTVFVSVFRSIHQEACAVQKCVLRILPLVERRRRRTRRMLYLVDFSCKSEAIIPCNASLAQSPVIFDELDNRSCPSVQFSGKNRVVQLSYSKA